MHHTQICFYCPSCHSFNTILKGIRSEPMKSHQGFHHLDIDFVCKDCASTFSKKFNAPAPQNFVKYVEQTIKGTHKLENLRISLGID